MDAKEEAGTVGHGGIALAGFGRCSVEKMDDVGMDLLQEDKLQVGSAEGGLKVAAVFEDVFLGVPFGETEIEDFLAVLIGDAAGLGAETVDEPGEFCEGGRLEDSDAAGFAFDPVWVGSGRRDRQKRLSYLAELTPRLECFRGSHSLLSINRRGTRVSVDCKTQYHCRTRFGVAADGKAAASCRTPSGGGN